MRRPLLLVAIVAVVLAAAVFQVMSHDPTPPSERSNTGSIPNGVDQAERVVPQVRPSPVDTATEAVRRTGDLVRAGFINRGDLIRDLASERFGPTLDKVSAAQLAQMTSALGAAGVSSTTVVWDEMPLTARLVSDVGDAARVEVWSLLVVGVPDHGAPRQVWRTVTIDLVWERDGWRIDGWESTAGPTPALVATEPISDLAALQRVLDWEPVAGGAG